MQYLKLVDVYQQLEQTTKRLEKTAIIAEFLTTVSEKELATVINLLQGYVFPQWDDRNSGLSSRLMLKAIAKATGSNIDTIEKSWNKEGDLGIVAKKLITKKKQTTLFSVDLTIKKVVANVQKLATLEGTGTVDRKVSLVAELLTSASPEEARFIVRTVLEELRIGIAAGIVRDAIAKTFEVDAKEVERAFDVVGDYGEIAVHAKHCTLQEVRLSVGRPLNSMLSILAKNVEESFKALGSPAQFEPKLDGFRLQIHKHNNDIKLFTRRLEEVTKQFPEVVTYIKTHVTAKVCILDAEAVGIDLKTGRHLPFQHVSQRIRRKYHIEEIAKKLPVEVNVFDVLFIDGKSLLDEPLQQRRKQLENVVKSEQKKIKVTEVLVTSDAEKARAFYDAALANGNEGVMAKNINSVYRPGRYVKGWCKLKPTLEPLDVVITGGMYGEGKRSKWLASFTVACRNNNTFVEIGKVGTGVKEKDATGVTFAELTKLLEPLILEQKGLEVKIKPKIVVEVLYEELQKSPTYSSGFAMRFPRILRLRTQEKTAKDVNTLDDVERIYAIQKGKQ